MAQLYERTDIYDLVESPERSEAIRSAWASFLGERDIKNILDVSIGTGSMTLPLQELGIRVFGSDLSEAMLKKCGDKSAEKGIPLELKCSDFRDLSCWEDRTFDCVLSSGNSLAYVENADVLRALEQMDAHVKPGGYLCFDSRNWDKIRKQKLRFYLYDPFFKDGNRINLTQVWDHNPDGSITFNLLYTFEKDNHIFQKEKFEEHYHPFAKDLAEDKIRQMGYEDIQIASLSGKMKNPDFELIDWYRIIARKPQTR